MNPLSFNEVNVEDERLALQGRLDSSRSAAERNTMGQFATPSALAHEILAQAKLRCQTKDKVRFLDPAIGTGAFYSALRNVFAPSQVAEARGYEIDPHYGEPAAELWKGTGLDLRIQDFTEAALPTGESLFDLIVCNPPYVRHHHLDGAKKGRLRARAISSAGVEISGLAGLYCYFLTLCHGWMAPGALAGWLVPSEFMDVNYGVAVKRYLLRSVTLLHIHRFDPTEVQFGDALVSSAVVWFRNEKPPAQHRVRMTFGGTLSEPKTERAVAASELLTTRKWTRFPSGVVDDGNGAPTMSDFFHIKRGLATGDNKFFILEEEEIRRRNLPWDAFRPILPSPRDILDDEVPCDAKGNPALPRRRFLLDCRLSSTQIRNDLPELWKYLEEGRERGVADRYICRHRKPWYAQESRPAAPFVCTYLGRKGSGRERPFRFILNRSRATAPNVYLMLYPTENVARAMAKDNALHEKAWKALNSIRPEALLGEGRVYGGGLHKLEPRELGNVRSSALSRVFSGVASKPRATDLLSALAPRG